MLNVQVVEDDKSIRTRLIQAIQDHPELCLTAYSENFRDAERALVNKPDVLLVDLGLPDGDGIELIHKARRKSAGAIKSIVFSIFGDEKRVVRAIEAGASGYLLKDTPFVMIANAIVEVSQGYAPISPKIAKYLLKRFQVQAEQTKQNNIDVGLSEREQEVLEYTAKGLSMKEVALQMDISYHTVASHTRKVYEKLGVNTRGEAIFEASKSGLIHLHST